MAPYIQKSSGQREPFNSTKFRRSLKKVGASPALIDELVTEVTERPELNTTYKIYSYAYKKLKQIDRPSAARYSLKYALYELGPEGFYFERFVGELFKAQGYSILVDQILQGLCVTHEVDVIIRNEQEHSIIECKFHNRPGIKTDVKVALYTRARFLDVAGNTNAYNKVYLVTNTQFTLEAIKYGICSGIGLLGWAYPEERSIAYLIESLGLHPITSLTCLTRAEKRRLLAHNILLCKDLISNPELLTKLGFPLLTSEQAADECKALCLGHPLESD